MARGAEAEWRVMSPLSPLSVPELGGPGRAGGSGRLARADLCKLHRGPDVPPGGLALCGSGGGSAAVLPRPRPSICGAGAV